VAFLQSELPGTLDTFSHKAGMPYEVQLLFHAGY
jgi:hypothetical protein